MEGPGLPDHQGHPLDPVNLLAAAVDLRCLVVVLAFEHSLDFGVRWAGSSSAVADFDLP